MTTIFCHSHTYRVEVDDKPYEVIHDVWTKSLWREAGEHWRVLAAVGIQQACRECDKTKPTFKRVVAAVKAALEDTPTHKDEGSYAEFNRYIAGER